MDKLKHLKSKVVYLMDYENNDDYELPFFNYDYFKDKFNFAYISVILTWKNKYKCNNEPNICLIYKNNKKYTIYEKNTDIINSFKINLKLQVMNNEKFEFLKLTHFKNKKCKHNHFDDNIKIKIKTELFKYD